MARYIQDAGINQPLDVVSDAMEQYLYKNRYIRTEWKGELVYMSADGDVKGSRYLIWSYMSGILHIEAWMKGSFGNETGLTGAGSGKRAYKESIDNLIEMLRQPVKDEYTRFEGVYQPPAPSFTPPAQSAAPSYTAAPYVSPVVQPQNTAGQDSVSASQGSSQKVYTQSWMGGKQGSAPQNTAGSFKPAQPNAFEPYVPDYGEENAQKAKRGLVFGAAAIFTSFIMPIFGLVFGIMGLGCCNDGMKSNMADKAKIGKILCIAAIVWSMIIILYYIFTFVMGMFLLYW